MDTITIKTGKPYEIHIGAGLFSRLPALLAPVCGARPKLALITDSTVDALYADVVMTALQAAGYPLCKYVFPAGERSKTLATVSEVYGFFAANGITRTDLVVALGGGVVGDLAGFAAASWLRGVRFVQIPTTFLAMIDSSVGGKTGVDLPQGKNLVGAFWQPSLVLCDPDLLNTLSEERFADGVAEAIKYGAIMDEALFSLLERGEAHEKLPAIIARCIALKKLVVEQDERDTDVRQWLNFGHTFGHAVEKYHRFTLSHGKGVSIGMVLITEACERAGLTPAGTAARIAACCERYGLPTSTDAPLELLCQSCMGDKKRTGSTITLVTLEKLGQAGLYPLEADRLYAFMGGEADG